MYTHHTIKSSLDYILTIGTLIDNSKIPGSSKSRVVDNVFQKAGEIYQPGITPLSTPSEQVKLYAFMNAKNPPFSASKTSDLFNECNMTLHNTINVTLANHKAVSHEKNLNSQIAITGP